MLVLLAALSLASAPVQDLSSLASFEAVCMAGAGENLATDAAATKAGWVFAQGETADDGSAVVDYYARSDGRPALAIGVAGDDKITASSCRIVSEADFENLVNAIDARLGFQAVISVGESRLVWAFTRAGERITPLTGVTDAADLITAARADYPVHIVTLDAVNNDDGSNRILSYERIIPPGSPIP